MRLIIFLALIYLAYRALKSIVSPGGQLRSTEESEVSGAIEDVMIKDPFCGVYFPKRSGVQLKWNGRDIHFCSESCRDKFIAAENQS
jgi:YHS domain-containing protein